MHLGKGAHWDTYLIKKQFSDGLQESIAEWKGHLTLHQGWYVHSETWTLALRSYDINSFA